MTRHRIATAVIGVGLAAGTLLASGVAAGSPAAKSVKPPSPGKWSVYDTFKGQYVAGGSFVVAKNQKSLSKLTVTPGPMSTSCPAGAITVSGKAKLHRVSTATYNGYYFGRKGNPQASPPFLPAKVTAKIAGKTHPARLAMYFGSPKGGKMTSGQITIRSTQLGICSLDWLQRKD